MSRRLPILLAVLAGALALGAALLLGNDDEQTTRPPGAPLAPEGGRADVAVSASLDRRVETRGSVNGFIHSLDASLPAQDRVAQLAPRLWRSDPMRAPIDRATAFGAQYQLVLSDLWGYPQSDWNGRGPPWRDLAAWEGFVRDTARAYRGQPVTWDIWNEPNDPGFWSGGQRRFFDVYSRANRVLREELGPEIVIGGPSISRYAPKWLAAFLDHCLIESCKIGFLSWHENLKSTDPLESISGHLADGRERFLNVPRYAPLGIREIHINEYVGRSDRHLAGEAVSYLEQLERGGADRAARSCWSREDCSPMGLDGLLTADGTPRSIWWAHRWYAQGASFRVRSESSDTTVPVLAAAEPTRAQVLLGYAPRRGTLEQTAPSLKRIRLTLRGGVLRTVPRVHVRAEIVQGVSGAAPQPTPLLVVDRTLEPEKSTLRLTLPELGLHEAMLVVLEPAED